MDLRKPDNASDKKERDYRETAAKRDQVENLSGIRVANDLISGVVSLIRTSQQHQNQVMNAGD